MATIKESNDKARAKVMEFITTALKTKKNLPWVKPWNTFGVSPQNYVSAHKYTGINYFLCSLIGHEKPYYLTMKQIRDLRAKQAENGIDKDNLAKLKKGSKSIPLTLFKPVYKIGGKTVDFKTFHTSNDPKKYSFSLFRYYLVFNIEDVENYDFQTPEYDKAKKASSNPVKQIETCENIISEYAAKECAINIVSSNRAFYRPMTDDITLPLREQFSDTNKFYATAFHEIAHSTGHSKRLNREGINSFDGFGSHTYSFEELVAELSASILGAKVGIFETCKDNSAAYVQGWLKKLTDKPEMLMEASKQATKAVEYIDKVTQKSIV